MGQKSSFYYDLYRSHEESKKPYWEYAYQSHFGALYKGCELLVPIGNKPDSGADKIIYLNNGTKYRVDEKVHFRNTRFCDDMIFLELEHVYRNGKTKRGWLLDEHKEVDYIAYSKEVTQSVYILPLAQVRSIWEQCGGEITEKFTSTPNKFFDTTCALVDANILLDLLRLQSHIRVPDQLWAPMVH